MEQLHHSHDDSFLRRGKARVASEPRTGLEARPERRALLRLTRRRSRQRSTEARRPDSSPALYDPTIALAEAAVALDGSRVREALRRSFDLAGWRGCAELVTDAARLIGEHWLEDRCDFMDVTLSVSLLQRSMRTALPDSGVPIARQGRVLLTAAPATQHTFGLTLTAARLERSGWTVELGWPFQPPRRVKQRGEFDAIGVSVSGPRDFAWAAEWSSAVRAARGDIPLVFGGGGAIPLATHTGVRSEGPGYEALLA